ncbi:MAG: DUF481 domain-containing protein [Candidatus Schmidhempelia sp.]|nr:DUF481 domain-containing protein [Candidatus Schmidhempelia sp.]
MHKVIGLTVTLFYSGVALADMVWLQNGDIISGKIKLKDDDKLFVNTDYAGTIAINTDKIKTFAIDSAVEIKQGLFAKRQVITNVLPSQSRTVSLVINQNKKQSLSLDDDFTLFPHETKNVIKVDLFKGHFNSNIYYNKGNNQTQHYLLDGHLTARHDTWRHDINAHLDRITEDSQTKTYNYNTRYQLDRFFNPQFFWSMSGAYRHDWIEDIKGKVTIGTGPGEQLWDNELGAFSLSLPFNYQYLSYCDNHRQNTLLANVKWDYHRYLFGKSIKLFTIGSIGRSFDDKVNLDLTTMIGGTHYITQWLVLNATLSKEKSKTKNGNANNTNYGFGIGITW